MNKDLPILLIVLFASLISPRILEISEVQIEKLIPNANKGGYTIKKSLEDRDTSIALKGMVFDIETKEPLVGSVVKIMCYQVRTDSNGFYSINLPISEGLGELVLLVECSSLGYKSTKTSKLDLNDFNNLELDFYMEEEEQLIYHCD